MCLGGCVLSRSDRVNSDNKKPLVPGGQVAAEQPRSGEAPEVSEAPIESTSLAVPASRYVEAFDAAREVLKAQRFDLDRVDARGGVITTRAKLTSGFATPWDTEQTTLGQEWTDLVNQHQRTVRVVFEPAAEAKPGEALKDVPRDLLAYTRAYTGANAGALVARVEVKIERIQRPGWRPDTRALRYSTYTFDPELIKRRELPSYATPAGGDALLAQRIAGKIGERLKSEGAAAGGAGR